MPAVPDYSADPIRRTPAALLEYARAAGRIDRYVYKARMRRLRDDRPDLGSVLRGLPQPAFLSAGEAASLTGADRVYARVLLGVTAKSANRQLAEEIEAAETAGQLRAICFGQERAAYRDRRAVVKMLRRAEREGRLDAAEYDSRLRAVETAKSLADLARLHEDIPSRKACRIQEPHHRIAAADRKRVLGSLAAGLVEGRFSQSQYEERMLLTVEVRFPPGCGHRVMPRSGAA